MGRTISAWQDRVEAILRDASNVDLSTSQIDEAGIKPALGQYSVDRPREVIEEAAGAGSAYLAIPSGWEQGFSHVVSIEYPARQNPPQVLDEQAHRLVRSTADVDVEQILLFGYTPAATEFYRITYTARWPTPTADPTVDKLSETAFDAVTHLAASLLCLHLASQAARQRDGALVTDFTAGDDRHRTLAMNADRYRQVYDSFLGRVSGGSSSGPVSRRMDFDPSYSSLFHGGRR